VLRPRLKPQSFIGEKPTDESVKAGRKKISKSPALDERGFLRSCKGQLAKAAIQIAFLVVRLVLCPVCFGVSFARILGVA
jgi:hypothetical protein